ncbi:hypothetical protein [Novipirellula artificiosorum]|uniref:Uncharacterized protein n=1 Tax=Novipirellula artificiosorum TaxID=2528016 RepID=A0A5C6DIM1_9BACT|nr:hypothetical protein [Novipirellula artificiosorum]TWU35934.1 hypothetical protein Poly41_36860 [Novipirellula artificiosorum]
MNPAPLSMTSFDGRLSVEFSWDVDRFAHALVGYDQHGTPVASLPCVNASDDVAWPCSPPIQQLSLESLRSGDSLLAMDALLGVGGAGTSHWSISVQWVESVDWATLKFELACRCRQTPESLGSQYPVDPRFVIQPGKDSILIQENDWLRIQPTETNQTGTIRWEYSVNLDPASVADQKRFLVGR